VGDESRDVVFAQLGEVSKLDEQSSEVAKAPLQNLFALDLTQLRKRHLKIAHAGSPLPACDMKSEPGQGSGSTMRELSRHRTEQTDQKYRERVFGDSFNASTHP
jgi:hypothetical protein